MFAHMTAAQQEHVVEAAIAASMDPPAQSP
jgi:hypothetical protein